MPGNPLILREKRSTARSSTFSVDASFLLLFRPVSGCYGSKMGADSARCVRHEPALGVRCPPGQFDYSDFPLTACPFKRSVLGNSPSPQILNDPNVPRAFRRLRFRFAPQSQLIQVFRRYFPLSDPIEQVLPENRWKIGPPNLRHQSPNVIRASSSFSRCRSAASRDSVSRFTRKKKCSFSASLD